ncbi:class I SAM-dependent methyltransferase [Chiayiivirga flava]|uniref:SAM-dependent methyltransferase n=1 Tax=Chiayiivirga flava TaxID=659595 RepID=A0A7W8D7X7_9GAMM|nr:class I SAM-dependent methyltransferase [Chiayiivirga flava]MBB5209247.1 SAM-dependent methyltransferase [Chiayiivirga flava]
MSHGWDASAQAWIDVIGSDGDWGRRHVLDAPMLARVAGRGFRDAVDIGCGEGRFCRMLQTLGVATVGIDPTAALVARARQRDPAGDYRVERAECLSLDDGAVDLAVAYLSLIDIPDLTRAFAQAHRVLRPGGSFLIANLQSFNTASVDQGWSREPDGSRRFCIDHYLDERPIPAQWRGIRIENWHRPMQAYLGGLLDAGFELRHFSEPAPVGVDDDKARRYRRVPNFLIMEWRKAAGAA